MVEFLKYLAKMIIPFGTNAIVSGIAAEATKNSTTITKVAAGLASFAISTAVSEVAVESFEKTVDDVAEKIGITDGEGSN